MIVQASGITVVWAAQVAHGETSLIERNGEETFQGLDNLLTVTRYYSLVIGPPTLLPEFIVTARSTSAEVTGIHHHDWNLKSMWSHPESVLSEQDHRLLENFPRR